MSVYNPVFETRPEEAEGHGDHPGVRGQTTQLKDIQKNHFVCSATPTGSIGSRGAMW
jgi:hypothetical protein